MPNQATLWSDESNLADLPSLPMERVLLVPYFKCPTTIFLSCGVLFGTQVGIHLLKKQTNTAGAFSKSKSQLSNERGASGRCVGSPVRCERPASPFYFAQGSRG